MSLTPAILTKPSLNRNNATESVGAIYWLYKTETITHVGIPTPSPFNNPHEVNVWADGGGLLSTVTITSGSPTLDGYSYEELPAPVEMTGGVYYRVGVNYVSGGDLWRNSAALGATSQSGWVKGMTGCYGSPSAYPASGVNPTGHIFTAYAWPNLYKAQTTPNSAFAVNGKQPIAAWIPSVDDDSDGTTTILDQSLDQHAYGGSLSWAADTDHGGVRAVTGEIDGGALETATGVGWSVSQWIKLSSHSLQYAWKWGSTGATSLSNWTDEKLYFSINGVTNRVASAAGLYTLNEWCHLVATYDAATLRLFVNGVDSGSASKSTSVPDASQVVSVGHTGVTNDDVRIFDSGLSQSDVDYLYNDGNGRGVLATSGGRTNLFTRAKAHAL